MKFGKWIGFVVLLLSLYILWQIRQLLLLLFTAIVLANALNILVKRLQRSGIKRGYAVLLSVGLLLAISAGFVWVIVPPFVDQLQQLVQLVPQGIEELITWINGLAARLDPNFVASLPKLNQITQQFQPLANQIAGRGLSVFYSSLGILLSLLLLLALSLMLLVDPLPYRQGLIRLFPSFYRRRADEILERCHGALQGWLKGIVFNMSIIAFLSLIVLLVLRIPLALAQAMLAGILTFIPIIGPALSVVPPVAIALLEEPWKALAVLILYIVIQQIDSHVLTPFVIAEQIYPPPAITLLAQVFFATFFGFLGLFLAIPLVIVGQIWFKELLIRDILDHWQETWDKGDGEEL